MSVNISKNGVISCESFSNFLVNTLDTNYYIEPDNSVWIRIMHHDAPATNGWFSSSSSFATVAYENQYKWFNVSLCNLVNLNKWEVMIKQKPTSSDTERKYRWIQNYNPMTATFDQTKAANVTFITTSGYTTPISTYGGAYRNGSQAYLVCNNNASNNWWGAIGCWTAFNTNAIPGYNAEGITSGYMDLYLRIDNDPKLSSSIYNNLIISRDFIEI